VSERIDLDGVQVTINVLDWELLDRLCLLMMLRAKESVYFSLIISSSSCMVLSMMLMCIEREKADVSEQVCVDLEGVHPWLVLNRS